MRERRNNGAQVIWNESPFLTSSPDRARQNRVDCVGARVRGSIPSHLFEPNLRPFGADCVGARIRGPIPSTLLRTQPSSAQGVQDCVGARARGSIPSTPLQTQPPSPPIELRIAVTQGKRGPIPSSPFEVNPHPLQEL